jgi:antitoxin CcdA
MSTVTQEAPAADRVAVSLDLDAGAVAEARANGLDIARICERALARENRAATWRRENADAIADANRDIEENGLWSDGLRLF